jgi:hypothetical protein
MVSTLQSPLAQTVIQPLAIDKRFREESGSLGICDDWHVFRYASTLANIRKGSKADFQRMVELGPLFGEKRTLWLTRPHACF